MDYMKCKMTPEMNFNNIHIDHIKPVSKFYLDNHDEFLKCCHFTNMQPLLATDNLEKSNKWTVENEKFWNENIIYKEYMEIFKYLSFSLLLFHLLKLLLVPEHQLYCLQIVANKDYS